MSGLLHSVIDAIGDTPLVELQRLVRREGLDGRLLAKLEYLNPGHSKKDRIALGMIRAARADGSLVEGQTVVELTSGNTGTGLAIVCRALGNPFVAVMSRGNTSERAKMMRALGAEVVLVDQAPGSPPGQVSGEDLARVETRAAELVIERGAFRADQFNLRSAADIHERTTGPELWAQSAGAIDAFVDFVGSAGTFAGVMRHLREVNPAVRGYLVEPDSAAVLAGRDVTNPNHKVQGGGYSMTDLPLLQRDLVHKCLAVRDEEAIEGARQLAREEGILGGFSAGAHVAVATRLLRGPERGKTIAFLVCDSGMKYLSTDLFETPPD